MWRFHLDLRCFSFTQIAIPSFTLASLTALCFALCAVLASQTVAQTTASQAKDAPMTQPAVTQHARGTFTVEMKPLSDSPAEGITRYSGNKQIHGDLEATSKGEMLSAGDPKTGNAGYVAIELVTGTLAGKHGSFVLQQMASMDASGRNLKVEVVPGSGTGELAGIGGTFEIKIEAGKHFYDLEYTLGK
jgi:hypothetical protein